ncbi:MAG: cupin domain-containing protein [Candidatus Promineifilaceae bacterium]
MAEENANGEGLGDSLEEESASHPGGTTHWLDEYTYINDLEALIPQVAEDTIISRTFLDGENVKGILFGFAAGQELSEHTASRPAILHFLSGEAELSLGPDTSVAKPGTWVHMPAHLSHSIVARTPVVMILLLVR